MSRNERYCLIAAIMIYVQEIRNRDDIYYNVL